MCVAVNIPLIVMVEIIMFMYLISFASNRKTTFWLLSAPEGKQHFVYAIYDMTRPVAQWPSHSRLCGWLCFQGQHFSQHVPD